MANKKSTKARKPKAAPDPDAPSPTEILVKTGDAASVRRKLEEITEKGREVEGLQKIVDEAKIALTAANKNHQKASRELTDIIRGDAQLQLPLQNDPDDNDEGND